MTEALYCAARWPGMPGFGAACLVTRQGMDELKQTILRWRASGAAVEVASRTEVQAGLKEYAKARVKKRNDEADRLIEELNMIGDTLGGIARAEQLLQRQAHWLNAGRTAALQDALGAAIDERQSLLLSVGQLVEGLEQELDRLQGAGSL